MQSSDQPSTSGSRALVLLGATGDLAKRMLWPSLLHLDADGLLPEGLALFGVARLQGTDESFKVGLRADLSGRDGINAAVLDRFLSRIRYVSGDVTVPEGAAHLAEVIGPVEQLTFFFALSPSLYAAACANLKAAGLIQDNSRLVLEKPIGRDLESSKAINRAVAAVANEEQIFRIDHYLGKETVQNLMALRFANALFEPIWRAGHIDHVQISVCETLGVENRGAYYEKAGAMRDMIQNHLLQLLCLVAMEAPVRFDAEAVRNEKVKILEALKPITGLDVQDKTVRGQYTAGKIGGQEVPAYYFEKNVDNDSDTETFVAVQAEIDNWRWAGVPFYLRTGKRLGHKSSEILIQFKPVPHQLFGGGEANRLLIRLQPEERISLQLMGKSPGKGMHLQPVELDLNLADAFHKQRRWDAYERLLLDVIEGDSTLFMRRDEVEAAWNWVDPIIKGWHQHYQSPRPYPAGSDGPEQASNLLERHERQWMEE